MQSSKRRRINNENTLFEWAGELKAKIENLKLSNQDGSSELDRCVTAAVDIEERDEICFIPSSMLLSVSVALAGNLGQVIQHEFSALDDIVSNKYAHAIDIISLAAFMVQQKQDEHSFWSPYLCSLPKEYTLPICWKEHSIKTLLKGTGLVFITMERIKWLRLVVEYLNQLVPSRLFPLGKVSYEEFQWAFCSIISRAFPKSQTSAPQTCNDREDWISLSEICLYPVLDMLNHKRNQKIEWVMNEKGVSFIAREKVPANTELFNNYGSKGNENLLGNYGFVLDDNPEDYFKMVLNTKVNDAFAAKRRQILENQGLTLIHMIFKDDTLISEKLLAAVDVMVASDVELRLMTKMDSYQSPKLRLGSLKTLSTLLQEKLMAVSEAIDESFVFESEHVKLLARVYRSGQQAILKYYLSLLQKTADHLAASTTILKSDSLKSPLRDGLKEHIEEVDDFTMTALLLIELAKQSPPSLLVGPMKSLLEALPLDSRSCKNTLGKDYQGDFKEFYAQEIVPLQKRYPVLLPRAIFSKDACLWSFTVLTLHYVDDQGLIL